MAAAVAFVSGHDAAAGSEESAYWRSLAGFPGTLVFYMGIATLPAIARSLQLHGRSPEEPAAVVADGTRPAQLTVTAPLSGIADAAARAGVRSPAVTVVGPVVRLREQIAWAR